MLGSVRFGKLRAVLFVKHGKPNTLYVALGSVFGASSNDVVKVPTPVSSVLHQYGWSTRQDGDAVWSGEMLGVVKAVASLYTSWVPLKSFLLLLFYICDFSVLQAVIGDVLDVLAALVFPVGHGAVP